MVRFKFTILRFTIFLIWPLLPILWTFLEPQTVKSLPAMHETGVPSLGQEDPLEKEMATHSSILTWKTSQMEEPGRLWCCKVQLFAQSMVLQRVRQD